MDRYYNWEPSKGLQMVNNLLLGPVKRFSHEAIHEYGDKLEKRWK